MGKLFLDDERDTPPGYIRAYTAGEAIRLLSRNLRGHGIMHISLDHDLGVSDPSAWSWLRHAGLMGNLRSATNDFLCRIADNELTDPGTGHDVAVWIELAARDLQLPRMSWQIHSANPVGENNMHQALSHADLVWNQMDF